MRRTRLAALAAALAVAGSGCTGGSEPPPAPTATPPTATATVTETATPTSTPTTTPTTTATLPSGFGLATVTSAHFPNTTGFVIGKAVRVGVHDAYDRVVYEFSGTGRPQFKVRYVTTPIGDPSGEPVDVRGAAYLEVDIAGLAYPEASDPAPSQVPEASLAGTVVAESGVFYGGFEAMGQTFIGVRDHKRAFRVFTLLNPSRLVVDIAH